MAPLLDSACVSWLKQMQMPRRSVDFFSLIGIPNLYFRTFVFPPHRHPPIIRPHAIPGFKSTAPPQSGVESHRSGYSGPDKQAVVAFVRAKFQRSTPPL